MTGKTGPLHTAEAAPEHFLSVALQSAKHTNQGQARRQCLICRHGDPQEPSRGIG